MGRSSGEKVIAWIEYATQATEQLVKKIHPAVSDLKRELATDKLSRREFIRTATLLGVSASVAYAVAGEITGTGWIPEANAALPSGGTLRLGMRVIDIASPHTFSWIWDSNVGRQVVEYLTKTGHDNVTRPYLLESWSPSEDLRTWTLNVRRGIRRHNGRAFTADDVIWNIDRVLNESVGSSVVGLMKGYMLEEYEAQGELHTRLWDANAIERVDAYTERLNCRVPQLAVPEHLFHYPFLMLDPEEDGLFGPGSNGTGAFDLIELRWQKDPCFGPAAITGERVLMSIRWSSSIWATILPGKSRR